MALPTGGPVTTSPGSRLIGTRLTPEQVANWSGIDFVMWGEVGMTVVPRAQVTGPGDLHPRLAAVLERLEGLLGAGTAGEPLAAPGKASGIGLSEERGEASQRMTHVLLERIAMLLENDSASQGTRPRARFGLVSKREAAKYLGISERSFERRVMRDLKGVRVGRRAFYDYEEIQTWLEGQKGGSLSLTHAQTSTSFASLLAGSASSGARANAILAELRSQPSTSTSKPTKTRRPGRAEAPKRSRRQRG